MLLVTALAVTLAVACVAQTRSAPPGSVPSVPAAAALKEEAPLLASKVLPNGLEVMVYEDHSVPLVTVEYTNKAGSAVESSSESGLSHLMEHLFFKTNKAVQDKEAYLQTIGELGISYNGTTKEEQCSQYLTATSNNLALLLHYLRDAARYPLFLPQEVERERDVVLEEIDRQAANPYSRLTPETTQRLFYKYPNRKSPIGSRDVVQHVTPEQIRAFWAKYWVPNNSALVITGDVNPQEAFLLVEQLFGEWARGESTGNQQPWQHPALSKSSGAIVEAPVQNVLIEVAWHGPSIGQDTASTYAADVFSHIVSEPGSRFQRTLVDSGLVNSVNVGYYTQRNVGTIAVIMQTSPQNARAALNALKNEIAHFVDAGYYSAEELQDAKTALGADDLYGREKPSEYAHTLSFWWASAGTEYYKSYQRTLAAVSRTDIRKYLDTYIAGRPRVGVVLLSPEAQQQLRLSASEVVGQ